MDMRLASLEHRPGLAITGEDLVFLTGQPTPYGMLEHLSAEWVLALRELGRRAWLLRTGVPLSTAMMSSTAPLALGEKRNPATVPTLMPRMVTWLRGSSPSSE